MQTFPSSMLSPKRSAKVEEPPTVIVTKSTVPVGTSRQVERHPGKSGTTARFAVASNPEFLREGAAIADFKRPDRIVIGTDNEWARGVMNEVYRPLFLNRSPILFASRRSAELIKYAANAFLATKITFINEMADLCEKVGADVQDIARGIGLDNRIAAETSSTPARVMARSCSKDTLALLKTAEDHDSPVRIVEAVVKVNDSRKRAMGRKVIEALAAAGCPEPRGRKVALLGLTFKPDADDMRDAPSLSIVTALQDVSTVRNRIAMSSQNDQLSMYPRSKAMRLAIFSSVSVSPRRPLTWAQPVIPGRTLWRRA